MSQLLKISEVCLCFGISRITFYRNFSAYCADGLKEFKIQGGRRKFTKSSVEALIAQAERSGRKIGQLNLHRRGRPKKSVSITAV